MADIGLLSNWVSYPWRIDLVSDRLSRSTVIHSPPIAGAGRRWHLSLIAKTTEGTPLEELPLYITVIDPTSLVVCWHFSIGAYVSYNCILYSITIAEGLSVLFGGKKYSALMKVMPIYGRVAATLQL